MRNPAHPHTLRPSSGTRTRTAPPAFPGDWPTANPRYRAYLLYGFAGLFFILAAGVMVRALWALGSGPGAWETFLETLGHPLYIAFHVGSFALIVWFGWRTFFQMFVKTQPPMIGPFPRPPVAVFPPVLAAAWLGASALLIAVLSGAIL